MAAASSYIPSIKLPTFSSNIRSKRALSKRLSFRISAQQQTEVQESEQLKAENGNEEQEGMKQQQKTPTPIEPQVNVKNRNLAREYGGQWLSSVTRHVRIYAAYIDPETCAMDQTQMDKLTLILDPTDEFLWTDDTCNKVYNYFQELVDHYEGAPLTEYTLRLIGSDIEHYIRKMLYDGEIKYNMNSRVLNFSMGKPRMKFNSNELPDVQ
ncbi:NAD(P)H-quinone oxidoreductase subunit M, chloroplastic-like [Chenopodium quinoa]|uniref:NAD(P)H-quinone oxidoreductase subunit M, chloroplastic n=1 Tax=Chenopodium quinoa TaxID=63459 RepID=A0A803L765_CHEQI|nr:NAD(P)H-quinone oxidoreductase subunit M, chloroplastic-like [Chenopodium quinoa]